MSLIERLRSKAPKRILALDGGGIRGVLTLGYLERFEEILRKRHRNPKLRLCDYFDLIGGTSTGSIIATALAIGMDAAEVKRMYLDLGGRVFGKKKWLKWEALFDAKPLEKELKDAFGDRRLGDDSVLTGLCIVTKRADTRSTWPLVNHPDGKYYAQNKDILLRDATRASAAAPVYFIPEKLDVGGGEIGAFVDGGVSMANNPALLLFLVATLEGFAFHWPTGEDRLLLTSIGTGYWKQRDPVDRVAAGKVWDWVQQVPKMLIEDANWLGQLILQYLSRSPTRWPIDTEIGDMSGDLLGAEPALSYLRYNIKLNPEELERLGFPKLSSKAVDLREMSAAENRHDLARIGEAAAAAQVRPEHFPKAFDLP